MSVAFLMNREEFGFHLGLDTGCILTRFKTWQSCSCYISRIFKGNLKNYVHLGPQQSKLLNP